MKFAKIFYNPFEKLKGIRAFILGVIVVLATSVVGWVCGVHFDGALDMHLWKVFPTYKIVLGESLINWLSLGLSFWILALLISKKKENPLTYLGTIGVARFPYLLAALVGSKFTAGKYLEAITLTEKTMSIQLERLMQPGFIIIGIMITLFAIWGIVLYFFAFKESSKLSGGKIAFAFILGIIIAEVISKLLIKGIVF
ncbi:hypothetical protein KAT51_06910 [bacterium]|nr:hypothetical protein [bacterium]